MQEDEWASGWIGFVGVWLCDGRIAEGRGCSAENREKWGERERERLSENILK